VSNPKVFEFAKEIGMTPLALMDKIREWHLPVKSHMAELEPAVLEQIKVKLSETQNQTSATTGEKKTTARKKTVEKKTAAPKTAKSPAKKAAGKTTETAAKTATPRPAGTVVRRKARATEEAKAEEAAAASEEHEISAKESQEVVTPEAVEPTPEVTTPPTPVAAAPTASTAVASPAAETPTAAVEEERKPIGPARKKEVAIGASGVASSAPRRNIVGRMDLSRVSPPPRGDRPQGGPGGRPTFGGGGPGAAGGFRPKGNLRAGFVQAPLPPTIVEDYSDFNKKKDTKHRLKPGTTESAASVRPAEEEEVKHFDAAEFRKREMVFQPKKKKGILNRPSLQTQITTPKASKRIVKVNQTMKLGDLAMAMGIKATELIKTLMKNGVMATMNTDLDFDTIALIVPEFGFEAQNEFKTAEEILVDTAFGDVDAEPIPRPPVVTIMGHVDHGKTSLLDSIRNANVAAGEAGGITQHIGAYQIKTEDGHVVTFLDTPGHEAFTAMRARGANVTDIAVIVVAADDGMMPQTQEAVNHAKAAGVPIIVAVNKMDKPGANPDRVKQQLTELELVPEEWGGTTIYVPVSALKKTGIKELLEQINLVAEVGELKANPKRSGTGVVIEARLEKGRGPVASILVKDGTVKVGQFIVAGLASGKVRSLTNDKGERVEEAIPGMPVEVLGLDSVPVAGDQFDICKDEKIVERVLQVRREKIEKAKQPSSKMSLEELFSKVKTGDVKELPIVLKTDVMGSLEAITGMFAKLVSAEVKVKVIHSAVGGITESDVLLASTSNGIIVGFNVRPDGGATAEAKRRGVEIRTYSIVYEMMDDLKKAMAGLLQPDVVEKVMGRAEVRNTFNVPKIGTIAGCFISEGKIQRSNMVRLIRDGKIIYEGKIGSLKRFKDDAREVAQGFECGIGIEGYNDVKVGDVMEAFVKEEIAKELTLTSAEA
jgi:translation initiation factor IF-2